MVKSTSLPVAEQFDRASRLLATDPQRAAELVLAILRDAPNDPRGLLILASSRRRLGDAAGALAVLEPLSRAYPRAALTHYELGMVLADLGRSPDALAALRRATDLNGVLAEAWRALGEQLFAMGDSAGAELAFRQHARASITDPRLKPAAQALFQGQLDLAEQQLRAHLAAEPNASTALQMLAETFARQGRFADAETLLDHCLTLEPGAEGVRFALADALFRQQKGAQAISHMERLLERAPSDPAYLSLAAACLGLIGEDQRVIAIYEDLLAEYPKHPKLWLNYGHALRTVGRREEAVAAYQNCTALAPEHGDAYWSLANLKVGALQPTDIAVIRAQLARSELSDIDRLHLHYALGKALEDSGDDQAAFENYAKGAVIRRRDARYDAGETTALTRQIATHLTRELLERGKGGVTSDAPIFIVGLPRSGSTLVEQILASHSQVEGTMELPDIGLIARELDRPEVPYPQGLAHLSDVQRASLGGEYLARTQVHRKLNRPHFVDKMPNNFQHIGLIHLILPQAKIIDVRRHPLGVGFSAFKQHFAQGQAFTYDLQDIGTYYRDYVDLMSHFDRVLPGRVHRVIYEDLVADTETQVRILLAHCGLGFEDACLAFHRNGRAVRTVSSEQVRKPIFRDGLDQWKRFEPWLTSLKTALGPALEHWRDT